MRYDFGSIIYVCVCVYMCVYVCMYVYVFVCNMYVYVCKKVCVCMYVCNMYAMTIACVRYPGYPNATAKTGVI